MFSGAYTDEEKRAELIEKRAELAELNARHQQRIAELNREFYEKTGYEFNAPLIIFKFTVIIAVLAFLIYLIASFGYR